MEEDDEPLNLTAEEIDHKDLGTIQP